MTDGIIHYETVLIRGENALTLNGYDLAPLPAGVTRVHG